ncbi:MAG: phage N-6-adenine-methyltransferase, partial [Nitrosopumilus sp.]|nr:phage N-6-adenine-methyltransferase [Nitrosopumilus sp.]
MIQSKLNGDPIDPFPHKVSKTDDPIGKAVQHMGIINVQDEWSTPQVLLQRKIQHFKQVQLNKDYADWKPFNPTFDYASSFINHKFSNYYTLEDNALEQEWT